jgi:hypothetical protein
LNDNFTFTETRELSRPINVEQVLQLVQDFYKEPLSEEIINKTFGENIEWKDDWMADMMEQYDGDISKLTKYNLLDDVCTPDFCGIHLMEDSSKNPGEYFIGIGPE